MTGAGGEILFSAIVAVADNGVIGANGKLPWKLKSDLARFRRLTMGHPIVMGRATFQSIGRPLDGRDSVVLSTAGGAMQQGQGIAVARSWPEAAAMAVAFAHARSVREIFVLGGANIFAQALQQCGRVYLTEVHARPDGDVFWTPLAPKDWTEISRTERPAGPGDGFAVTDLVLDRSRCLPAGPLTN